MADVYEIKNRIDGLKSIHNVTYAMQIVTISRLKRINMQLQGVKESLSQVKENLAHLVAEHPEFSSTFYPEVDETKAPVLVIIFSNRGFCGSFNQDVVHATKAYCVKHGIDFDSAIKFGVGKKAKVLLGSNTPGVHYAEPLKDLFSKDEGVALFDRLSVFMKEKRRIYFSYFEFKSIISQKVVIDSYYPPAKEAFVFETPSWGAPQYLEPSRDVVEQQMLSFYYYLKLFQAIRDSASSEFSQRFLLMKSAVDNVNTLRDELSLELNKERQRSITQEISEIISTFKALSKA